MSARPGNTTAITSPIWGAPTAWATTPPAAPVPERATHRTLSNAIAKALYPVSAHELADECVRFGMTPQGDDEDDPMLGKEKYVKRRLRAYRLDQLAALGHNVNEEYPTEGLTQLLATTGAQGVDGDLKNLIFAANGPKPDIVVIDAINNTIDLTRNREYCLVYDRPLPPDGLTWQELVDWWIPTAECHASSESDASRSLYRRLFASLGGNGAEEFFFKEYCSLFAQYGFDIPALIPQVYLHYDPYTKRNGGTLVRQRMDFLLLLPNRRRVVIEVDGVQHYADANGKASPTKYAEMVSEDRKIRLLGYEVFRFGGQELVHRESAAAILEAFFVSLLSLDHAAP